MPQEFHRLRERKKTQSKIQEIGRNANSAFVIHYSCESFYDIPDGRTPRVTSIAVRSLPNAQTHSFSIHKLAEIRHIPLDEVPNRYDELEREMLTEFFGFLKNHPGYTFVHWNMRDINYGFQTIGHRFRVLGGEPHEVPDEYKFDLARALFAIFGATYMGHAEAGRFINLCKFNHISDRDALTGAQEAAAFNEQQYVRLHQSTLRKVDMLANVFERARDGSLKTNAKWHEIYGFHPKVIVEYIQMHWVWGLIGIVSTIAGLVAYLFF